MTIVLHAAAGLLDLAQRDVRRRDDAWRALDAVVHPDDVDSLARDLAIQHDDEDGEGLWGWRRAELEAWLASRRDARRLAGFAEGVAALSADPTNTGSREDTP